MAGHYDAFPYPDARLLTSPVDPRAGGLSLEWDVGWGGGRFSHPLQIWVAGCGTVQATEVALRHPGAQLLATDLSERTLRRAEAIARAAGAAERIEFLRHDLCTPLPRDQTFDLIDCIGVLHHLPEPRLGLETLRGRLAAHGVIDLMLYQEAHRAAYRRFQQALAILQGRAPDAGSLELAVSLAGDLVSHERTPASVREALAPLVEIAAQRPAWFADTLMHPLEHGYTPQRAAALARSCGMEFAGFAYPELWDPRIYLSSPEVIERLDRLDPLALAEVLSLLLSEDAPFLDLYLAHADAPPPAQPDDEALLAGTLRPHGPWLRQELVDDTPVAGRELSAEPQAGGGLLVRGPRGATRVGPDAGTLLELVGTGTPTHMALAAWALRLGAPVATLRPSALAFVRRLLGPSARLLVFEPATVRALPAAPAAAAD